MGRPYRYGILMAGLMGLAIFFGPPAGPASEASPAPRVALVIGNADYSTDRLDNPVNDARDMAALLESMGFDVVLKENAGHREMETAVIDLGGRLDSGDVGLFYYAGHGIQLDGRNYLIPVDATIETKSDVRFEALDAGRVLGKMEDAGSRTNIIVLDACRENPFERRWRGSARGKGLASMSAPSGSLIAYATAPGDLAEDGPGRNGVFTANLLKHMKTPGLKIEDVLKRCRLDVITSTDGQQVPWESSSLTGDFFFVPGEQAKVMEPLKGLGKLVINVSPDNADSSVWINGIKYGTLREFTVRPGEYQVRVTGDGYRPFESIVTARPGEWHTITANLEAEKSADRLTNSLGMEFVWVTAGSFIMGSPEGEPGRANDETMHMVTLTKGFYMQTTEVTQGQWEVVMGRNPSYFEECGDDCPVEQVSWNDVQEFIEKLNSLDGRRYRLPTESEWEYAARAGTTTAYHWGDQLDCSKANYGVGWSDECKDTNPGETLEVGSFPPNRWGLHDMHGNVYEWCRDWYGKYPSGPETDPTGLENGAFRVGRGGSWLNTAGNCRSAYRNHGLPDGRNGHLGFRVVAVRGTGSQD